MGRPKKLVERVEIQFPEDEEMPVVSPTSKYAMAPKSSCLMPALPESRKRKMVSATVAPATKRLLDQEMKRYPDEPAIGRILDDLAECVREYRQLQKLLRKRDWGTATLITRLQQSSGEKSIYIRPIGHKARARTYIKAIRDAKKASPQP
ncbi:MAG: hypothetical protein WA705_12165 [Candidatus Ozemobacteraceae bacterium]